MATYAIGDIQGCFEPLTRLLAKVNFKSDRDQLWLAGDMVNRGPNSLATLRYCYQRRDNVKAVLGNHDLHLLAVALGHSQPNTKDTIDEILQADDAIPLLNWLLSCPLLLEDEDHVLTHAGIYPGWSLDQARDYASEVQQVLGTPNLRSQYFETMYGNTPSRWQTDLTGPERWRFITNCFTRMRLLTATGDLDLKYKGAIEGAPDTLAPWFNWQQRVPVAKTCLFGHWASLEGKTDLPNVIALDTGCVWGGQLTALCLESGELIGCDCK